LRLLFRSPAALDSVLVAFSAHRARQSGAPEWPGAFSTADDARALARLPQASSSRFFFSSRTRLLRLPFARALEQLVPELARMILKRVKCERA